MATKKKKAPAGAAGKAKKVSPAKAGARKTSARAGTKRAGAKTGTAKPALSRAKRPENRQRRLILILFGALLAILLSLLTAGALRANRIEVRRAEVRLKDLPAAFDGRTILFASDIDLCGLNTAGKSADLFRRLQALKPDALVLGGDYTSPPLFAALNRGGAVGNGAIRARMEFFQSLKKFKAPLGKFAICAPEDPDREGLRAAMKQGGVQALFEGSGRMTLDGSAVALAGLVEDPAAIARAAAAAKREDCVIAVASGPNLIPQIMINEVKGGGAWCDMVLTGHTHGGQVRLFGANALSLSGVEKNYLAGWNLENEIPILTTTGVGCEGINVRLGTRPEVWLITLRRPSRLPDLR